MYRLNWGFNVTYEIFFIHHTVGPPEFCLSLFFPNVIINGFQVIGLSFRTEISIGLVSTSMSGRYYLFFYD